MPTMTSSRINEKQVNDTDNQQQRINIHRHPLANSVLKQSSVTASSGYKQKCLAGRTGKKNTLNEARFESVLIQLAQCQLNHFGGFT